MKKVFWIAVLTLAWIYGSGYLSLGEAGTMKYLDEWENLSLQGDADAICDMMHDDLEFSIDDGTMAKRIKMEGGKAELCDYVSKSVPAMKHVVSGMSVTREDVEVKRDWLHPWTAEVSYTEQRSISMAVVQMHINSIGEDQFTLVKTLTDGVKIKRMQAKTRLANPQTT